MARRTTAPLVQGILDAGGDYNGTSDLTPYCDTATVIVDRVATCATSKGITLTSTELELIERWLAAHCYVQSDQTYAEKTTQRAKGVMHGQTGMYLENSKYGQQAMLIDYSGCLYNVCKQQRPAAFWLGKPPSSQIPYFQRD